MTSDILYSQDVPPIDWPEITSKKMIYGPKGAMLAALPRAWTPPFVLLPSRSLEGRKDYTAFVRELGEEFSTGLSTVAGETKRLIIRSSVIGESIWDRGTYKSVVITCQETGIVDAKVLGDAIREVLSSAKFAPCGLVIQRYFQPRSRGEFGNLLRISKTRDQWELSTESQDMVTSRVRFNTQRDEAAIPQNPLRIRAGLPPERLFGSVAAWLNNELMRGQSKRLNCEWITDNQFVYVVQVDEEDEDFSGLNPFQLRIAPWHRPAAAKGAYFTYANQDSLAQWDKLKVLEELWEPGEAHKPTLFYAPLSDLDQLDKDRVRLLENDFRTLIGADNIIVRTSVRAGAEKIPNLPRTECVSPNFAAEWCLEQYQKLVGQGVSIADVAFVTHRFIAARASAWARAAPDSAIVEINSLWGLPDALQYCPYDIWEVHVPTEVATEYPEYKSNILIPRDDGGWEYARVKNELARHLSMSRREAIDVAERTAAIAKRLGRPCHVMWFVGCVDDDGVPFNLPWYWTEAHEAEKNPDRSNYQIMVVSDPADLERFQRQNSAEHNLAIELSPTDLNLMRDTDFIVAVGRAAVAAGVPVLLAGSTLAHAYFQLRREGCTVISTSEKDYSRIRRHANFGKLVRDKIPDRIAERKEAELTQTVPPNVAKGFLTGKLLEEALEIRNAQSTREKTIELGDLFEVVRGLAKAEGISMDAIVAQADAKKRSAGGFDDGLVLLQTGILGRMREGIAEQDVPRAQVLGQKISGDTYEIPFSFFGFMETDQPRSIVFDDLGIRLDLVLKGDRIEVRLSREAEQLELPLDKTVEGRR
jgi:predicted house-cleaning noncanonical NTP pyrophosphatase (MazG superfamily)